MGEKGCKVSAIHVNRKWCKGCGICIEFCPKNVYEADKRGKPVVVRLHDCIDCRLCELRCPDLAITFERGVEDGCRKAD